MSRVTCILVILLICCTLTANAVDSYNSAVRDTLPDISVLGGMTQSLPDCSYDKILKLGCSLDVGVAMHDPVASGTSAATFTYEAAKKYLAPLISQKVPLMLWWSNSNWDYGYLNPDPVILENGKIDTRAINFYNPEVKREDMRQATAIVEMLESLGAGIRGYYVLCSSNYGEVEHVAGDWFHPQYGGYSVSAKADFRQFLHKAYNNDLTKLNAAWGTSHISWDTIEPPRPRRDAKLWTFDNRNDWSDYSQWRTLSLSDYMQGLCAAVSSKSSKPVGIKISPMYNESAVGPFVGNLISSCAKAGLQIVDATDGHAIADLRYMDTVRRYYKVPVFVPENDGGRYGLIETKKVLYNSLMAGCDAFNYCQLSNLDALDCGQTGVIGLNGMAGLSAMPNETYYLLAEASHIYNQLRIERPRSKIAFLQSAYSGFYRAPEYSNYDVRNVYDNLLSNNHQLASWGAALGYPDIIDEQLIRDGGLNGIRMLIVPNTSLTTVPDDVLKQIKVWINNGGWLVATGPGTFLHRLGEDRRLHTGDQSNLSDSFGGLLEGTKIASSKLKSDMLLINELKKHLTPLLSNGKRQCKIAAVPIGKGGILLTSEATPMTEIWFGSLKTGNPACVTFFKETFPAILKQLAQYLAIRDFAYSENARVSYCGLNHKNGKHTFIGVVIDPKKPAATFTLPTDISGPAEFLLFNRYVTKATCSNGSKVQIEQGSENNAFQDPTNTHYAGKVPIIAPYARIQFNLNKTRKQESGVRSQESGASHPTQLTISWD